MKCLAAEIGGWEDVMVLPVLNAVFQLSFCLLININVSVEAHTKHGLFTINFIII